MFAWVVRGGAFEEMAANETKAVWVTVYFRLIEVASGRMNILGRCLLAQFANKKTKTGGMRFGGFFEHV